MYRRALMALRFYQYESPDIALSILLRKPASEQEEYFQFLESTRGKWVHLHAYCLMPNHFHFLVSQSMSNGISTFTKQFEGSHTKFFNATQERHGPLFLTQFKAVLVETESQLLHVSRYIHLNPFTDYIAKTFDEALAYRWSSLSSYQSYKSVPAVDPDPIIELLSSRQAYLRFVRDNADYQRHLGALKHLWIER